MKLNSSKVESTKFNTSHVQDVHNCFSEIYLLVRQRQYDTALNLLCGNKCDRLNKVYKIDTNHAWYNVGNIFFHQGEYATALKAFKKSLRTRIDDTQALAAIAECYSEMGKPSFAERYFRKALSYQPEDHSLIYNLANALFDQGRYQEAIAQYLVIQKADGELFRLAKKNIAVARKKSRERSRAQSL